VRTIILFTSLMTLFSIKSLAQAAKWADSYRSYTIEVSQEKGEVVFSYLIRFSKDKEEGRYETNSLDTFLMLMDKDLATLPPDNSDVLFYLHGMFGGQPVNYNYTLKAFQERYLEKDRSSMSRIVGYRWPAQNPVYKKDKEVAYAIAEAMADNCNTIISFLRKVPSRKINFIANSLGTELFKEMMRYELEKEEQIHIDNLIVSAPDLHDRSFEEGAVMSRAMDLVGSATVYFSTKDFTLSVSKNLNKENRLGLNGPCDATSCVPKLSFVEVTLISDEKNLAWKMSGHSYVRASDRVSADMLSAMMGVSPFEIPHREVQSREKRIFKLQPAEEQK